MWKWRLLDEHAMYLSLVVEQGKMMIKKEEEEGDKKEKRGVC